MKRAISNMCKRVMGVVMAVSLIALLAPVQAPLKALGAHTDLVSLTAAGIQGDADVARSPVSISADGRYVAFASEAQNLSPESVKSNRTIYVKDRTTGGLQVVNAGSDGEVGFAPYSRISDNGRFVAFTSNAHNLGVTGTQLQAFVRDLQTGVLEKISVNGSGEEAGAASDGNYYGVNNPSISADGRYISFSTTAINMVPGVTPDLAAVTYIKDRLTGALQTVSVDNNGAIFPGASTATDMSADGRFICFVTSMPFPATTPFRYYLRDVQSGITTPVSPTATGQPQSHNVNDGICTISDDNRYVAFNSEASDIVSGDTNNARDVFVFDRQSNTTVRASVGNSGQQSNNYSRGVITGDGRHVVFESTADNLVTNDTNGYDDIFVRNLQTNTTVRVSVNDQGEEGNGLSGTVYAYAATADAGVVAYASRASNLVSNDINGFNDVFVQNMAIDSTAPTLANVTITPSTKATTQTATLTATAQDDASGIAGGEYFIGTDPGLGNGATATINGSALTIAFNTSFTPGVYPIGVRVRDGAGNWSATATEFLVVYSTATMTLTGSKTFVPSMAAGDILPGLTSGTQTTEAEFGLSVRYHNGALTGQTNDFIMDYEVGQQCQKKNNTCTTLHVDSTTIEWMITDTAQTTALFQGTAAISLNGGVPTNNPYRVQTSTIGAGSIIVKVYAPGANPNTDPVLYQASGTITQGAIKIKN